MSIFRTLFPNATAAQLDEAANAAIDQLEREEDCVLKYDEDGVMTASEEQDRRLTKRMVAIMELELG